MQRIAIFPGSFDPITIGHEQLVRRALPLFDAITIVVGVNVRKQYHFPLEQRIEWIRRTFADLPQVSVDTCSELTVDYCRQHQVGFILRGLRNANDYAYEAETAKVNNLLYPAVETVMMLSNTDAEVVSSSTVRELIAFGRDVRPFLPQAISSDFA